MQSSEGREKNRSRIITFESGRLLGTVNEQPETVCYLK